MLAALALRAPPHTRKKRSNVSVTVKGTNFGVGCCNTILTGLAMEDYKAAMKKTDDAMMSAQGSTPDAVFARKMSAHHQGATEMAQIQLKHGSDADAKRSAQQTLDENTKSKAELQDWLKSHGVRLKNAKTGAAATIAPPPPRALD